LNSQKSLTIPISFDELENRLVILLTLINNFRLVEFNRCIKFSNGYRRRCSLHVIHNANNVWILTTTTVCEEFHPLVGLRYGHPLNQKFQFLIPVENSSTPISSCDWFRIFRSTCSGISCEGFFKFTVNLRSPELLVGFVTVNSQRDITLLWFLKHIFKCWEQWEAQLLFLFVPVTYNLVI